MKLEWVRTTTFSLSASDSRASTGNSKHRRYKAYNILHLTLTGSCTLRAYLAKDQAHVKIQQTAAKNLRLHMKKPHGRKMNPQNLLDINVFAIPNIRFAQSKQLR